MFVYLHSLVAGWGVMVLLIRGANVDCSTVATVDRTVPSFGGSVPCMMSHLVNYFGNIDDSVGRGKVHRSESEANDILQQLLDV